MAPRVDEQLVAAVDTAEVPKTPARSDQVSANLAAAQRAAHTVVVHPEVVVR